MKTKTIVGLVIGSLAFTSLAVAAESLSAEAVIKKCVELRRAHLRDASPQLKAKYTASAKAAADYLKTCGRACNLGEFLDKDFKVRLGNLRDDQKGISLGIVIGEISEMTALDKLKIIDSMQKSFQTLQLISNASKMDHDVAKALIQNIRA